MQIQVNTDTNIAGDEPFLDYVIDEMRHRLRRFSPHLTRIEVHLADQNAGRAGVDDKRCTIGARLEHRQPVAVRCNASSVHQAIAGACDKLARSLEHTLGKRVTSR